MTIKEKLAMMAQVRKANEQRQKAWIEERKAYHSKYGIADMVQISEVTLSRAAQVLNQKYVRYLAKASNASKPEQKNKYMAKAREIGFLLDEIWAVLDPKE